MTGMSRALMGYIVDEVFDGSIEDPKVIEDIYAAIKRHEAADEASVKDIEGGRFEEWTLEDFAAQCRMQSREQLDPEFSRFMAALAKRLSASLLHGQSERHKALEEAAQKVEVELTNRLTARSEVGPMFHHLDGRSVREVAAAVRALKEKP